MRKSKSVLLFALQIAACAGLLPRELKADPAATGAKDEAKIADRVARIRQVLYQTAVQEIGSVHEIRGVMVDFRNWRGVIARWHNGGWSNGAGFQVPPGWPNSSWPNGSWAKIGWVKYWFKQ
jgi:hypothetical protein